MAEQDAKQALRSRFAEQACTKRMIEAFGLELSPAINLNESATKDHMLDDLFRHMERHFLGVVFVEDDPTPRAGPPSDATVRYETFLWGESGAVTCIVPWGQPELDSVQAEPGTAQALAGGSEAVSGTAPGEFREGEADSAPSPEYEERFEWLRGLPEADSALLAVARVCHEANRAYCQTMGDDSQPDWGDAPVWQRASALEGVRSVKLHPDLTAEQSHRMWWLSKQAAGWIFGPVKDAEAKTHPCMVPFTDLPAEQQAKDRLFIAVAKTLLEV